MVILGSIDIVMEKGSMIGTGIPRDGGHRTELRRKLFREGAAHYGAISGGAQSFRKLSNFPFLIYDDNDPHAGLRCVACKICEKECPPQCIYIVKSDDKKPDYMGKPQFYPKVFDIDISVCMSCQNLRRGPVHLRRSRWTRTSELRQRERFNHSPAEGELSKPNEYYHKIHPVEAAAVDKIGGRSSCGEAKKKAAAEAARKPQPRRQPPPPVRWRLPASVLELPAPGTSSGPRESS
jgi:NADH-quinone oxidoreductase subunit I